MVRANPAFVHSQAVVVQEAGTEIPVTTPIVVYARVLPHDAIPDDQPYAKGPASAQPPP